MLCVYVGCVDVQVGGVVVTRECRPSVLLTVQGRNLSAADDWVLQLRSDTSLYILPGTGYLLNTFYVRTPGVGNVTVYDVNRSLSAEVYSPRLRVRSAVLLSAVTLTGQAFVLSSVSGCAGRSENGTGTYGCQAGQRVTVVGSGFSLTAALLVGGQRGANCQFVSTTVLYCYLPSPPPRQDAPYVSAQLVSGQALSSTLLYAVQFTPTPIVRQVTGCSTVQLNTTAGCNAGQQITVQGSARRTTKCPSRGKASAPGVAAHDARDGS